MKSISKIFIFMLNSALLYGAQSVNDNLREACRKRIAGKYLEMYDLDLQYAKTLKSLEQKIAALETEIKNRLELIKKTKDSERDFKTEITLKLEQVNKNYREILRQYLQLLAKDKKEALQNKQKLESFRARMLQVFVLKDDKEIKEGYPFRVEYIEICPKYRSSCPLSTKHAEILRSIFVEETVPIECERYSGFLQGKAGKS